MLTGRGNGGRIRTLVERRTRAGGGRFFQRAAVIREALDQTADQVVRPCVRDVAHHLRHVDYMYRPFSTPSLKSLKNSSFIVPP